MRYDFSGYATKSGLRCSDGRVIGKGAFKDQNGKQVPLVWQHQRNSPENILGHAVLENRDDGVYAYCVFNDSENGQLAKGLVAHGDINQMSIFANKLDQVGSVVRHGSIIEVSLVTAAANPGARIDNVCIEHSDGSKEVLYDEAEIFTGVRFNNEFGDVDLEHEAKGQNGSEKTIQDIFDDMTEEQKSVVYAMLGYAVEHSDVDDDEDDSDDDDDDDVEHSDKGGNEMKNNVFEGQDKNRDPATTLTHDDFVAMMGNAKKYGSVKTAFEEMCLQHGIENLEILFPEAKATNVTPEMLTRQQDWVAKVWNATHKTPFSRIKSVAADLTKDEARAKGYIKGKKKEEETFALLKRVTTPQTVYKKQGIDNDDAIDITDFDIIAWLKAEMRLMLNEELARAVLVGDGRTAGADDKINETNIRPIYTDEDLYTIHYKVEVAEDADNDTKAEALIDAANRARKTYRGSGSPTLYIDSDHLTTMLLSRDKTGRRMYATMAELASALRVKEIVEVPVMENLTRVVADSIGGTSTTLGLCGIIVNLSDYSVGADRGGAVTMFDDFDIDYNRQKYLIETRCSGALTRPYSAIVLETPVTPVG